jgi:predicted N-acetyltransferase YhbS
MRAGGAQSQQDQLSFRPLSIHDAELIDGIATSAFGPSQHRLAEIRRYFTLEPNYWLLAIHQGQPAGVVGATDYGPFAYLGMMTVRKELQRRGIGGALFRQELEWLRKQGVSFLRLDATEDGYPIYLRNGFEVVDRAVLHELPTPSRFPTFPIGVRPVAASDVEELAAFDTPIFGADRTRLFRALVWDFPGRAFASHDRTGRMTGFLFAQSRHLGPWVARDPRDAEALLRAALTLPFQGLPMAITPERNRAAFFILDRFGFTPKRESRHMQRGGVEVPSDRTSIYGQTSFAVG